MQCLECFLLEHQPGPREVVEFGSGDGSPVVRCLSKAHFEGVIHGFELSQEASKLAQKHAAQLNLEQQYQVRGLPGLLVHCCMLESCREALQDGLHRMSSSAYRRRYNAQKM